MSEELAAQKYKELVIALKNLRDAEANLVACKRRVEELSGLTPNSSQYKDRKKTVTVQEFRRACDV
ncbi:MAG: hypothetical protein K2H64_10815 [Desulfovibrio sp.]|nr:hypothetical protein [Desulfovibrio sp.]